MGIVHSQPVAIWSGPTSVVDELHAIGTPYGLEARANLVRHLASLGSSNSASWAGSLAHCPLKHAPMSDAPRLVLESNGHVPGPFAH